MSKHVNVNGINYSGVSQVQLKTADGGTAMFKDVDEIVTPSGAMNITENGTFDVSAFASAIVNVVANGDGELETGTVVGNGTNTIEITTTGKKSRLMLYGSSNIEDYSATNWAMVSVFAIDGWGQVESYLNYNSTAFSGGMKDTDSYTAGGSYCHFEDGKISVAAKTGGAAQPFLSTMTYNWCAW